MKLDDIFKDNNISLNEAPEVGVEQILGLDPEILNQLDNTEHNIEGFPLYSKKFGDNIVFAIKDNDDVLSIVVGQIIEDFPDEANKQTLQILRAFTPEQHRRKGYAEALYYGLSRLLYRVVSDTIQSPAMLNLWKKIQKQLPNKVKLFDLSSKQYVDDVNTNDKNILFVLEDTIKF